MPEKHPSSGNPATEHRPQSRGRPKFENAEIRKQGVMHAAVPLYIRRHSRIGPGAERQRGSP